ncbi:RcnB family protein [Sphingomonas sp. SRS2]|uniref:RcnB family protein n=1 Tax=Sphingomonas sp. SRS2 TaxID=133190 RepID=UPI00061843BE|nr:RcnB family protein [Sphingomonas sp. SRS2]KKC26795.1 hypothetical protein WP12_07085 [Sphingomonas sp. SRS2]
MIGLLLGAVMVSPIAAQAQERGRYRGDARAGAQVNGDARREAVSQAREAQRAVERPAPVQSMRTDAGQNRRQWQGGDRNRSDDRATRGVEQRRENAVRATDANRDRGDRNRDGDNRRWDRDRTRDGDRAVGRGDRGQNWERDRDRNNRNDGNRRWTTDRRDWNGRDWDRRDNDRWDRNWRNDRRYSWQDYRKHNRNIYRQGRYDSRHGYSYRRWSPGYRFDSFFYSSSYWINDPSYYRLPPAYGPYRWVRYFDDVVLVDTRDGEIVDIIYSFFL